MDVLFKIESITTFSQVLEEVLDNLYGLNHVVADQILHPLNIKAAKEDIKNIILDTNLDTDKVRELLQSKFNNFDNDKGKIFISLLENKKSELLNSTIVHYNCTFGETVNSFNWKLKLVCGTSDLKTLTYTLLQLALYTITMDNMPGLRLYELNIETLSRLIETLEDFVGDNKSNEIGQ